MKYVYMFVRNDEEFDAREEPEAMQAIGEWFGELGQQGKLQGGAQLTPSRNATTVRWNGGGDSLVTDGPFSESKETIGGFAIIEVADLDEAIAIAGRWPARTHAIELRPVARNE
jgi:hypothetical protein